MTIPPLRQGLDSATLAIRIADRIRDSIVRGRFSGGEPLKQAALAAEFGVSLIPVREALRLLEAEGFITVASYRGAVVAPISPEELTELIELRVVLDAMLLRAAAANLTDEDLNRALELLEARDATSDPIDWFRLNWEMLETLMAPADRPLLFGVVMQLHHRSQRYYRVFGALSSKPERPFSRVRDLIDALRRRDVDEACRILIQDYRKAAETLARILTKVRAEVP